mmetsp:Transcript_21596/g.38116  ORF Transcript_21596/g.38116 Transcript_21596/m.38116 type:complete len:98 (+) Transcript_21596:546-839(+)
MVHISMDIAGTAAANFVESLPWPAALRRATAKPAAVSGDVTGRRDGIRFVRLAPCQRSRGEASVVAPATAKAAQPKRQGAETPSGLPSTELRHRSFK